MESQTQKMPSHIEVATKFINELFNMSHEEQVEAFQHVRKTLLDGRKNQDESMRKNLECLNLEIDRQNEGSKAIASGL